MTNLLKNTVTIDDWNVYEEVKKIKSVKNILSKVIVNPANAYSQLWRDYATGNISVENLHKILRGKLLKSVYKMSKQKYPFKPIVESPKNMYGWTKACAHIECLNAGNRYWLGVLLKDLLKGKLEAEQGKIEEIEELLSEYPHTKEPRITIDG